MPTCPPASDSLARVANVRPDRCENEMDLHFVEKTALNPKLSLAVRIVEMCVLYAEVVYLLSAGL